MPDKKAQNATQKEPETKAAKFVRLGSKRMTNALAKIDLLKGLANKATYEWTPEQRDKVVTDLKEAVNNIDAAFKAAENSTTAEKAKVEYSFD